MSDNGYVWMIEAKVYSDDKWEPYNFYVTRKEARREAPEEVRSGILHAVRVRKYVREEK